jgi:hypothetical protein
VTSTGADVELIGNNVVVGRACSERPVHLVQILAHLRHTGTRVACLSRSNAQTCDRHATRDTWHAACAARAAACPRTGPDLVDLWDISDRALHERLRRAPLMIDEDYSYHS